MMDDEHIYDSASDRVAFPDVNYDALERPYFDVFEENGLKGVRDVHSKTVVVNPIFEDIGIMHDRRGSLIDNIINIKENGRWYLYRLGCGYLVSPHFEYRGDLREGLRHVSYGGLHGFVNESEQIVIPFVFCDAKSFSENLCAVEWIRKDSWDPNDGWGYIDHSGKCVVHGQYAKACDFYSGYACVQKRKSMRDLYYDSVRSWGLIDKCGKTIMSCDNNELVVQSQVLLFKNAVQPGYMNSSYVPCKDDIAIARDMVFVRNSRGMVVALNRKGELLSKSNDKNACKGLVAESWRGIRCVAAGFDHALGLTYDGNVISTGDTHEFTKSAVVRWDWRNIAMLDACEGHVAGVTTDGRVEIATERGGYVRPYDYTKELREITNARRIAVGWLHAAVLLADGSVRVVGEREYCNAGKCESWKDIIDIDVFGCYYSPILTVGLSSTGRVLHTLEGHIPDTWRDVVSVSCGGDYIVSLNKDGQVKACGRNDWGQCNVEQWPPMLCVKGDFFTTVAIDREGWVWMTPIGRTNVNVFTMRRFVFCGEFRHGDIVELSLFTSKMVGRARECAFFIDHPSISRRQISLWHDDSGVWLEHVSDNPNVTTTINNVPIHKGERRLIQSGDVVGLSKYVMFSLEDTHSANEEDYEQNQTSELLRYAIANSPNPLSVYARHHLHKNSIKQRIAAGNIELSCANSCRYSFPSCCFVSFGKSPMADVVISRHWYVSRFHAAITYGVSGFQLEVDNARYEVFVNGKLIRANKSCPIKVGDKIGVGSDDPDVLFVIERADPPIPAELFLRYPKMLTFWRKEDFEGTAMLFEKSHIIDDPVGRMLFAYFRVLAGDSSLIGPVCAELDTVDTSAFDSVALELAAKCRGIHNAITNNVSVKDDKENCDVQFKQKESNQKENCSPQTENHERPEPSKSSTLRELISRSPFGLDADVVLRIAANLVDALIADEWKGTVYHDIIPEDVVICGSERIRIVKNEDARTSCKYDNYRAPECRNVDFKGDVRSCIFSVGVIIHEMLTGNIPCQVVDGGVKIHVSTTANRLLSHIAEFLGKSLVEKREDRYSDLYSLKEGFRQVREISINHGDDHYQILQYVGRGCFGEVFKARLLRTGQLVAIKHLMRWTDAERLRREAIALKLFKGFSFCQFIDNFEIAMNDNEVMFLVTSFLPNMPGSSMRDIVKRPKEDRPGYENVLRAFVVYSQALAAMHSRRIFHGDISPSHLYYCEADPCKSVIMGLGSVRNANGLMGGKDEFYDGPFRGTVDYMPPEVVLHDCNFDAGCDVYSLGLCLYEALTGKRAYPCLPTGSQGLSAFYIRAKNLVPPTFDDESVKANPELLKLLIDMTNPNRELRIHNAEEVTRRLERILQKPNLDHPPVDAAGEETQILPDEELWSEFNDEPDSALPFELAFPQKMPTRITLRMKLNRLVSPIVSPIWKFCKIGGIVFILGIVAVALLSVIAGLVWLCEHFGNVAIPLMKDSLLIRGIMLLPWLSLLIWTEAKTGRLPNKMILGCLLTGVAVSVLTDGVSIGQSFLGALVGGALFLSPFFLKSCGAGEVKLFAAIMSFWGIKLLPFVFLSTMCMSFAVVIVRRHVARFFRNISANCVPSSPFMLLASLSTISAIAFWNGHGMIGGYVFIVATLLVAACARWLFPAKGPSPSKGLLHCGADDDDVTIDPRTEESETYTQNVTHDGDEAKNPLADMIAKGTIEVSGFRFKQSLSKSRTSMLFQAECIEDGCMGQKIGTPVVAKLVEETDALPPFSDLQEAVSRLQKVKSRHVVRYYGCFQQMFEIDGEKKRYRVVVMEPLDGADLRYRIMVRSPMFYADEIMYVLDQLLEGLCELSAVGIVHRDIKPSNIFICRDGAVKLIDFGLSKVVDIDLCPKNRRVVGTPEFSAPDFLVDEFRGDEISDIFSVGMVLYYMNHGVNPHRAMANITTKRMGESEYDAIWSKVGSSVNAEEWWNLRDVKIAGDWLAGGTREYIPLIGIHKILQRALAFDRRNRFTTFLEFRNALQDVQFVQSKLDDEYTRVISDSMGVSGAGSGWIVIYGRSKDCGVVSWSYTTGFGILIREDVDENKQALQILVHRMYDQMVSSPFADYVKDADKRGAFAEKLRLRVETLIRKESFAFKNVSNLSVEFAEIKSKCEWSEEIKKHAFAMSLS